MKSKLLSFLLSLTIAFTLWYYVITVVSPGSEETYYNIPVVFEGETVLTEDRGMMITSSGEAVTVNLKLSGNRTDLAKVNAGNITIKVNLTKVYDPGEHELTYDIIFPGDVPNGALTVESKFPEAVILAVEKRIKKPVDVQVVFSGSAAENFMADTENRILDYPTINVTGPSSVVELIDHARIDVDLTDRVESISENYRFTLCDAEDNPVDVAMVTTDVAEVHLDVKIQRFKQIPLTMLLTYGGGAWEDSVEVSIEPATISVSGGEALLGSLDLSSIEEDLEGTYEIVLPEGITNLSERTEAQVKIRFKNLTIKEFEVSNIKTTNVPEGMEAELMSQVLKVRLRGPAELMEKLTAEDIQIVVNFKGKEAGSYTIKASIKIQDKAYEKVGPVGSYSIPVTLRLIETEE